MVHAIPEGYSALTGYLIVDDVAEAISFYKKALGAEEITRLELPDGSIGHAEIKIGGAPLMLGAANEKWHTKSAKSLGGSPVSFVYYCDDVHAAFTQASGAGMKEKMPVTEQFWGDLMGSLTDPFGIQWSIAQHVRDVSEAEMKDAMKQMKDCA